MKDDQTTPNQTANKSKAEGERWKSDDDTVEKRDRDTQEPNKATGITNRPIGEEQENQNSLPERGEARDGANAGHGHSKREE